MQVDFRPNELDLKCKEETKYHMSIRHKKSGIIVADTGENKFALECQLLEKIRQQMRKDEETDNARSSNGRRRLGE